MLKQMVRLHRTMVSPALVVAGLTVAWSLWLVDDVACDYPTESDAVTESTLVNSRYEIRGTFYLPLAEPSCPRMPRLILVHSSMYICERLATACAPGLIVTCTKIRESYLLR